MAPTPLADRRLRTLSSKRISALLAEKKKTRSYEVKKGKLAGRTITVGGKPSYLKKRSAPRTVNGYRLKAYGLMRDVAGAQSKQEAKKLMSRLRTARKAICTQGKKKNPCAIGTQAQVYHGTALRTTGGLKKGDLIKSKGRIIPKAKSDAMKKSAVGFKKGNAMAVALKAFWANRVKDPKTGKKAPLKKGELKAFIAKQGLAPKKAAPKKAASKKAVAAPVRRSSRVAARK
jgi:hypothetical protein